jgi:hypothetical protein
MRNHRKLAILLAVLALLVAFRFLGPWEKSMEQWRKSQPPAPYRFESLKNRSDEEIARFMSGNTPADSRHPADAPDSHFPDSLWKSDPKVAALSFAEANRRPEHRKNFMLSMDANPSLKAPDEGWIVFDPGSASCPLSSSGAFTLIALRFGNDQPFLFHAVMHLPGVGNNNSYVDGSSHSQQLIPLSPDEARFIAHTVFWLEHIQSENVLNRKRGSGHIKFISMPSSNMSSTADGYGRLDWLIPKLPPRRITESLWATDGIAARWSGEYDEEAGLNLANYLLTEALPKHLGKRWQSEAPARRSAWDTTLTERLKPRLDDATKENLSRVIHSALTRHEADPWPADALVSLAECAGESGLKATLPALENLLAGLPSPSVDEAELSTLDARFHDCYEAPSDPVERKKWDRYESLQDSLKYDVPTQVRPPLARAIRQIHAMDQAATLSELAKGNDPTAMWAIQRLYQLQPDAYFEALIDRFLTVKDWGRGMIFNTLAELNPVAARRLRDSLTPMELSDLFFTITRFEVADDPQGARIRIPALFDLAEKPTDTKPAEQKFPERPSRGQAIELLSKLPLNAAEQQRFERLLLKELLTPEHDESFGNYNIPETAAACVTLPDPDRFWDALFQATLIEKGSIEFDALLDALASLAVGKPEPHLLQLTEFLRPRIAGHKGYMNKLFTVALALDLRTLAPNIQHFATSGPSVPDSENPGSCKDAPCFHRYHSARHVSALWQESDADTRARMWTALLLESPYDFVGTKTIPSSLRDHYRSAITAASPEIRKRLVAMIRSNNKFPDALSQWLGTLP